VKRVTVFRLSNNAAICSTVTLLPSLYFTSEKYISLIKNASSNSPLGSLEFGSRRTRKTRLSSHSSSRPVCAKHLGNLAQWPAAICQKTNRLPLEFIHIIDDALFPSNTFLLSKNISEASTFSREGQIIADTFGNLLLA
jgi:hypothetical protein